MKLLHRHDTTGDHDVDKGARLFVTNQFAKAVPVLEHALDLPLEKYSRSFVLTLLGNCYDKLENYDKAVELHERSVAEDPANHQAWVNLGAAHRMRNEYDKAEECYGKAMELAPDYAELHSSLGVLHVMQGKYDEAVRDLERAVRLNDALGVSHANLALAYANVGRFSDAELQLKLAAVRGYPNVAVVRQQIAGIHAATGAAAETTPTAAEPVAAPAEAAPTPAPAAPVEFDAEGKVTRIVFPAASWSIERSGSNTYCTERAGSLLHATELLKTVGSIPDLTYYVVETPDGTLGRDMLGFYTEAPIGTKDLHLEVPAAEKTVDSQSLTAFGDHAFKSQGMVAMLQSRGQYARFVLLMECGRCGYKSPVETVAGPMERQCYCCGAMNTTTRAPITVYGGSGEAVEI